MAHLDLQNTGSSEIHFVHCHRHSTTYVATYYGRNDNSFLGNHRLSSGRQCSSVILGAEMSHQKIWHYIHTRRIGGRVKSALKMTATVTICSRHNSQEGLSLNEVSYENGWRTRMNSYCFSRLLSGKALWHSPPYILEYNLDRINLVRGFLC